MLEVMRQETDYQHGNDCIQKNCYTILKCHETFIVMNIRRYTGWGDRGIEIVGKTEFDNLYLALDYYNNDLRTM